MPYPYSDPIILRFITLGVATLSIMLLPGIDGAAATSKRGDDPHSSFKLVMSIAESLPQSKSTDPVKNTPLDNDGKVCATSWNHSVSGDNNPTADPRVSPHPPLPGSATRSESRDFSLNWLTGLATFSQMSSTLANQTKLSHLTCPVGYSLCLAFQPLLQNGLTTIVDDVTTLLLSQAFADSTSNLNPRATAARVPVIMYHDILPQKEVFFDVTPDELERHFQLIQDQGLTPITLDQLIAHLKTAIPLPEKPVLLTFDDGYSGHYQYVFPLLKKYQFPAVFSIFTDKVNGKIIGRSTVTWNQLKDMVASPFVTIASHSVSHFSNLTQLSDQRLRVELTESKRLLEGNLGIPIRYFTYPEGHYDQRVANAVRAAGYYAALTMSDTDEKFAGQSESLLAIARFGQSRLEEVIKDAWGGPPLPKWFSSFDFNSPVQKNTITFEQIPLILLTGGRPVTIHGDTRYQVADLLNITNAVAGVDGGFFSLEFLDSNVMIGPVLSQNHGTFFPGGNKDVERIAGRPLVLINPDAVTFVPFKPQRHNTLEGLRESFPGVTDAFVAAAWLVKQGQSQDRKSFGNLFDFDAARHRAFWGINQLGQPVVGVSTEPVDSITLGEILLKAGLRDAVMLDSGASTSLAFQGESMVGYTPRPVPHVVALLPPQTPCLRVDPKLTMPRKGE